MVYKDYQKQLANQREFYKRNPHKARVSKKKREKEIQLYVRLAKEGKPCKDCGKSYPYYVMQFDHRERKLKECTPSKLCRKGWCDERIQKELDKCDIVCGNCHAERTYQQNMSL